MTLNRVATPFGRRAMTLGLMAAQRTARETAPEATVHKWRVFEALSRARARLGLGDRAIAVLQALLSFHPETALSGGEALIVHPSNARLSERAHGLAPATLRRHLAALVEAGVIIRRDSPNGKRYARRGEDGAEDCVFGFDLAPLVARAAEFAALAEAIEAERRALKRARARITLARRDIGKMIALGEEEGLPAPSPRGWAGAHADFLRLIAPLRRVGDAAAAGQCATALEAQADALARHLEQFINSSNPSASDAQSERHQQIQITDSFESEPACRNSAGEAGNDAMTAPVEEPARRPVSRLPLGLVLQACPGMAEYASVSPGAPRAIADWAMFLKTAAEVRPMLGISPDAWRDATETFGVVEASVLIGAILQKGDAIRFPGGYLRALTEKKRAGAFALGPILMALINNRGRNGTIAARQP